MLSGVASYDVVHLSTGYNSRGTGPDANPRLSDHDPAVASFDFRSLNEVLMGTPAPDTFRLEQGGDDTAYGMGSRDIFYFGGAFTANDTVDGGDEFDVIVLQGNYSGLILDGSITNVEGISLQSGTVTKWGQSGLTTYDYSFAAANEAVAPGSQFRINGQSLTAGEDLTFDGSLETDGGTFLIYAGYGKDDLTGGSGNDIFYFEAGRFGSTDTIDGGGGQDAVVISGYGPDPVNPLVVTFEAGTFTSVEALSFNVRFGSDPSATPSYDVTLKDGNIAAGQTLIVNASSLGPNQTLDFDGSEVADGRLTIYGGAGNDTLTGGLNADVIRGLVGRDTLTGGGGNDVFAYDRIVDSNATRFDSILDFNLGDIIDVSAIDANTGTPENDAFEFVGTDPFSGQAGELRYQPAGGSVFLVEADVDGNGYGDFQLYVTVTDAHPLTVADFNL
jgi:Ca2+-binding RTX toxin-like protein